MDLVTYKELHKRVLHLEAVLAINHSDTSKSVATQLNALAALWESVLRTYPALKSLHDLFKSYSGVNDVETESKELDSLLSNEVLPDTELKIQAISLQFDAIAEAHANLSRFEAIDKDVCINPFHGLPLNHHINDSSEVNYHADEIRLVARNFDLVLLKSMVVFEQFADAVSKDNTFWLEIMQQLKDLRIRTIELEREKDAQCRY